MNFIIRKSSLADYPFLLTLEKAAFPECQRSTSKSLKNSLTSAKQAVYIIDDQGDEVVSVGALILFIYKKTLRIYSIGVLPAYQGKGVGALLIQHTLKLAQEGHYKYILLEAHQHNQALINWYVKRGFEVMGVLDDYYTAGENGVKMRLRL